MGKTVSFKIRIENDGSGTDPLTVLGGGSGKGYSVTYFAGTTNITSKVVAGTYKVSLAVAALDGAQDDREGGLDGRDDPIHPGQDVR